jgi:hypothetical protein
VTRESTLGAGCVGAIVVAAVNLGLSPTPAKSFEANGAPYGARDAQACPVVQAKNLPSGDDIIALVRCYRETESGGQLTLISKINLQVGPAVSYVHMMQNDLLNGISHADVSMPLHRLKGSYVVSICVQRDVAPISGKSPDANCDEVEVSNASGACWYTTFGQWQCNIGGTTGEWRYNVPPPDAI